jgi:hypothetical protein
VAIGAYRGFINPLGSGLFVSAVKRALVFSRVTALAGGVELDVKIPPVLSGKGRVRVVAQVRMALDTCIAKFAVNGTVEHIRFDVQ